MVEFPVQERVLLREGHGVVETFSGPGILPALRDRGISGDGEAIRDLDLVGMGLVFADHFLRVGADEIRTGGFAGFSIDLRVGHGLGIPQWSAGPDDRLDLCCFHESGTVDQLGIRCCGGTPVGHVDRVGNTVVSFGVRTFRIGVVGNFGDIDIRDTGLEFGRIVFLVRIRLVTENRDPVYLTFPRLRRCFRRDGNDVGVTRIEHAGCTHDLAAVQGASSREAGIDGYVGIPLGYQVVDDTARRDSRSLVAHFQVPGDQTARLDDGHTGLLDVDIREVFTQAVRSVVVVARRCVPPIDELEGGSRARRIVHFDLERAFPPVLAESQVAVTERPRSPVPCVRPGQSQIRHRPLVQPAAGDVVPQHRGIGVITGHLVADAPQITVFEGVVVGHHGRLTDLRGLQRREIHLVNRLGAG